MNFYNAPGLRYAGHVSHPYVNDGQPLPMFEPVDLEGHPSINTMKGWDVLANKANQKAFVSVFGRDPVCEEELLAWEDSRFSKEFLWKGV